MASIQSILNKISNLASRTGLFAIQKGEFFGLLNDMTNKVSEINDNVNSVAKSLIWQAPVANFAALATTYPIPLIGWAAMVNDEGIVYSYNGTLPWKSTGLTAFPGDVATLQNIKDNIQSTILETASKNLFIKKTITIGEYLRITNVNEVNIDPAWFTTDFINIEQYTVISSKLFGFYGFYDKNKLGIIGDLGNMVTSIEKPSGAVYFKNSNTLDVLDLMMIEGASIPSFNYQPQQLISPDSLLDKSINLNKLDFVLSNLFDKNKRTDNVFLELNGWLTTNEDWFTSDFIDATLSSKYSFNKGGFIEFYNDILSTISGIRLTGNDTVATIPSGCRALKFSLPKTEIDTCMCEPGDVVHAYMEFNSPIIPNALIEKEKEKETKIVTTEIIVKQNGTIGTDCDYTDILSAIDSIVDNSPSNRYIVKIMNGVYDGSDDGHTRWGFKNYVDYIGQSKSGVKVIRRNSSFSSENAVFDPAVYGQQIIYASVRNMTCISYNGKSPIHVDCSYDQFASGGTIEVINCDLINENTPEMIHYQNGIACGLRIGQRIVARGVNSNGQLWCHDSQQLPSLNGCTLELYDCRFPFTEIADTYTYSRNKFIMKGCKTNYVIFSLSDPFAQKKAFTQWSWDVQLESNQIEYIVGKLYNDVNENQGFWDAAFSGKFGIQDSNIHMYCKNNTSDLIPGYLVSLDSNTQEVSIKNWVLGDKLYGMALDTINPGDYGTVQHSGILKIYADAITPILFNSPLELNSGGHLTPHLSGHIVGYAMESLDSGIGVIKIKMV